MAKNKTNKLFLVLGGILFSFVGLVGCSNERTTKGQESITNSNDFETIESQDLNEESSHRTGPSPIRNISYFDFVSFNNYFKDLNMDNHCFVSFDLDNISSVGTKNYLYSTNQPFNHSFLDSENYIHSIKYEFFSMDNPIGSGIDNISYKIDCYDILFINNCTEYDFNFKLVSEVDTILLFDLLLNDECVMKIKIDMEENYDSMNVENVVSLLENNIMIIKGEQV